MMYRLGRLIFPVLLSVPPAALADPVADFYAGKTVSIVISAPAGGGFDIYARILQPHLSKYIPGRPNVIVRNMPGAGGIVAMNHLYNAAARDGSVIAMVHNTVPFAPLMRVKGAKFDALKFKWLASLDSLPFLCVAWHTAPVKTFADLMKHELIVGSTGPGSGMATFPRILNQMFGTRFKVVSGYKGGNSIYLAMERGEVQGRCVLTYPTLRKVHPDWLAQKKVNIIAVLATERDSEPALKDVPFVYDLARTAEQKAILDLVLTSGQIDRPMLAPPGAPVDRIAAIEEAIRTSVRDREFLADFAQKGLTLRYRPGDEVTGLIRKIYATPSEIVEKTITMMQPERK